MTPMNKKEPMDHSFESAQQSAPILDGDRTDQIAAFTHGIAPQAEAQRLAELGWQSIECDICGSSARAFPTAPAERWAYRRYGSEPEKGYTIVALPRHALSTLHGRQVAFLGDGEIAGKAADAICEAHNAAPAQIDAKELVAIIMNEDLQPRDRLERVRVRLLATAPTGAQVEPTTIQKRATDLHEKASMPWNEAERMALVEIGIDDAQIDELIGECAYAGLESLLSDADELRDFTRSVLVHQPRATQPPALSQDAWDFTAWLQQLMALADQYWEASPAARYRFRAPLHATNAGMHWRARAHLSQGVAGAEGVLRDALKRAVDVLEDIRSDNELRPTADFIAELHEVLAHPGAGHKEDGK